MRFLVDKFHQGTHAFISIWMHEYRHIFTDSGVMLLIFGAGLLYPLLYSAAYSGEVANEIPTVVVDQSSTNASRTLVRMLDATPQLQVAYRARNMAEAQDLFLRNKVNGVVLIDADFQRRIMLGQAASVAVYADASYFMLYKQVLTGAKTAALTYGAGVEIRRLQATGQRTEQALQSRSPIGYQGIALFNPAGGYGSYAMPAVLVLILQQTLLLAIGMMGGSQHEFQAQGNQMQTSLRNGGAAALVLGRAMAYFTLYLVLSFLVLIVVPHLFHLPEQAHWVDMFWFLTPFLWASIFLGLTLANFFRHRETSILVLLFTTIPFVFLSGLSWPPESMPVFWRWFAQIIPSSSAVQGVLRLHSMGLGLGNIRHLWLQQWALAWLYYIVAISLTKWRALRWQKRLEQA